MSEEIIQQDANAPESSEPESTSQNNQESAPETVAAPEQKASVPFHEDPRIQEYIERQIAKQTGSYSQQIQDMQRQLQDRHQAQERETRQAHPFVQKLSEIDPKYGEWAGGVEELKEKLVKFENWQQEQQRTQIVQQYESGLERMHTENNVPKELHGLYKRQIDAMAMSNPNLGLKDLPNAYKQVHEEFSKILEGTKRAERKSYVTEKTKDASSPTSQPRGKVASPSKAPAKFQNREEAYASVVKAALSKAGAESDL